MKTSIIKKTGIVIFWLLIWSLIALLINNNIVLVGPHRVLISFFRSIVDANFIRIVLNSTLRIGAGFLSALILACLLGGISYSLGIVDEFLKPLIYCMKTVPVASFVVILLIWSGSEALSFFISFIITFPSIYTAFLDGLKATDRQLLKMTQVFRYSRVEKFLYLYRDTVMPYLISASKTALGLAWKSGVAAEVIGLPRNSLGERVYMSKIYLDTEGLFSWTLWVIVLSFLFERLVLGVMDACAKWKPDISRRHKKIKVTEGLNAEKPLSISDINVSFGEHVVLKSLNVHIEPHGHKAIVGPSGIGKTSLINEIMSRSLRSVSCVFQEDRLLEEYDAKTNVLIGKARFNDLECVELLKAILPNERLDCPLAEYSGGMKRRVALVRALCHQSDVLLLDEPFTGMDDAIKARCVELIKSNLRGRILILVSHNMDDCLSLGIGEEDWIVLNHL